MPADGIDGYSCPDALNGRNEAEKDDANHTSLATSFSPALTFFLRFECGRARRASLHLPHGKLETPVFMAVGTHGTVKGVTIEELEDIGYQIILGNTYHLGNRPGTEVLETFKGLHSFMNWKRNLLTDSGGFQMVSLLKLAAITEEGVAFSSPVDNTRQLLTPEESISIQNIIGADVMMALDDVVSATLPDKERVAEATRRTTRWLDRCIAAHRRPQEQNLFGIVQGGLHSDLRLESLSDLKRRNLPGYAIGGLSGGEEKSDFWRIVELCTRPTQDTGLPRNKPRYLMGVGYPLDIVVCVALGVDMFDCVYPTRTARFATALVAEGTIRIKLQKYATDFRRLQDDCRCVACKQYSRAFLHGSVSKGALGIRLLTLHNLTYMFDLCASMRTAIETGTFPSFVIEFLSRQFHSKLKSKYPKCAACKDIDTREHGCAEEVAPRPPEWVRDALEVAGISLREVYIWEEDALDGKRKRLKLETCDSELSEAFQKKN